MDIQRFEPHIINQSIISLMSTEFSVGFATPRLALMVFEPAIIGVSSPTAAKPVNNSRTIVTYFARSQGLFNSAIADLPIARLSLR